MNARQVSRGLAERPPPGRGGFLDRLVAVQVGRPWIALSIAAAIAVVGVLLALRLTLRTGFDALLPEGRPSVRELDRVGKHIAGVSSLFVVLEGGPNSKAESLRAVGDKLVIELEAIGPPYVGSAESGVHEAARFLEPRAGLYAPLAKLQKLDEEIAARQNYEVAKATGMLFDDTEPPALTEKHVKELLGVDDKGIEQFPGGYYQSADGHTLVVAVRSKIAGGDFSKGIEALGKIRGVIEHVNPASFDPSIKWGLAGDLASGVSEYAAIQKDLTDVGLVGLAMLFGVVLLYYLRLQPLVAMLVTIGIGLAWTFGAAYLLVGHLNIATGFLFSIVAGNGINFGILFMARYLEGRRAGLDVAECVRAGHAETWLPTLTAAVAASASYGSLAITEFRGFRDFGFIGGAGMVLCWIATYATLPSILAVIEKIAPMHAGRGSHRGIHGGLPFGAPFAALVEKFPRGLAAFGVAASVVGLAASVAYVRRDPMEYDTRQLRSDMSHRAEEIRLNQLADSLTGFVGLDGMAILVDRKDQVGPLKTALEAKRDAAAEDAKPFDKVYTLEDFVPKDQAAKIPVLFKIRDRLKKAKAHSRSADDATFTRFVPPADLKPFDEAELPDAIARAFTESDGTRGRIVYLSPISARAADDAHYLFRWADAYRETKLPDGSVIVGSGRAVIYADMWAAMLSDIPRAVFLSFAAVALVVAVAFRFKRSALLVLGSLLVGVGWMGAGLSLLQVKINFMNFIALPITFGIGVDYAVNLVSRYLRNGHDAAGAVRATGGAVILCSLTTTLGYVALMRSANNAVRSLGVAAAVGEVCCLLAAVVVLPAILTWRDRRAAAVAAREGLSHG